MKEPMKSEYLWDGSGEPDPEIQRLESALVKFRHTGAPPDFSRASRAEQRIGFARSWRAWGWALAAAAVVVAAIGVEGVLRLRSRQVPSEAPSWDMTEFAGTPRVGAQNVAKNRKAAGLRAGEVLETDGKSSATLTSNGFGEIQVEPNTRLRLLRTSPGRQHLELERGTIQARIWASPGDFAVDTPSAQAIDLGCVYTLHVDDSGAGLLRTTIGWVGFKSGERESFIPAGAVCATRPKIGPGTPYFEDAPEAFRAALSAIDFDSLTPEQGDADLDAILRQARARDALTLWHLLARVDGGEREKVYRRLAEFVPPPAGLGREGGARLDQQMLDEWWSELGYGDISLWRTWERSWSETEGKRR